jgi:hypothetical protein
MIKIQNQTATHEPIPVFLLGLEIESLVDLSWTDPALGVSDCAWWPEHDASAPLGQFETYGDETLTIDAENKRVVSIRAVLPMPQEQIDALAAEQATSVRAERNTKLTASDWTQVADATVDQAAWATYRQALRDVPSQEGFPWTITWPEQP